MPTTIAPSPFHKKKAAILSAISTYTSPDYIDNSPKGTIDAEIIDLINEINDFDGNVTTSSCAGRVAVFVEGRAPTSSDTTTTVAEDTNDNDQNDDTIDTASTKRAGPGGKGYGNKWLYVSHEPVPIPSQSSEISWHALFGLTPSPTDLESSSSPRIYPSNPRLIKLSFSPLILHILCSSLHTARPLLAAAINAGFRESGVQSLKILDDEDKQQDSGGVMLAIRTAGCAFETVVGYVEEFQDGDGQGEDVYRSVVSEQWLGVCVGVINARFEANVERRERLRREIRGIKRGGEVSGHGEGWEDKDERRLRKREEGLKMKRQKERQRERNGEANGTQDEILNQKKGDDVLDGGMFLEDT